MAIKRRISWAAAWEIPCSTSRAWTFSGPILSSLSTVRMISPDWADRPCIS